MKEKERIEAEDNQINQIPSLQAALPKFWRAYDGQLTQMSTQHTIRAKELKELYSSLQMDYLTTDERLDVLLSVKQTVAVSTVKIRLL